MVVRRRTIREVVKVKEHGCLRDKLDRWFQLGGYGMSTLTRLAGLLDVPVREADRVEGRLIQ